MPLLFRKMQTRLLRNSDMKKLVRVLRNDAPPVSNDEGGSYEKATEIAIKKLPRRLRSSPLSSHGALCRAHKGLDAHLMTDIWAWVKYELGVGIGRFLYPIIMSNVLSESDKHRARQLEPVVRIFKPDWTLAESSPPGIPPIDAGDKWVYQQNGCPACILARIGSDENALFALFAGMYGHHRSRSGGQKGVDKIKSRRLRFVRYWMRTHQNGKQMTFDAYDLGVELKTLRCEAKASLRQSGQPTRYTRDSVDEVPVAAHHRLDNEPAIAADLSEPYTPKLWSTNTPHDPKIGPTPPRDPTTPTVTEDWHEKPLANVPIQTQIQPAPFQSRELDTLSLLPARSHTNPKHRDSVLSPATSISIASFNTAASMRGYSFDPFDTPEDRIGRYQATHLPKANTTLKRHDSILAPPSHRYPVSSLYSSPSCLTLKNLSPPPQHYPAPHPSPAPSRLTLATSIASFNSAAPNNTASARAYRFDPFETPEERVRKYEALLRSKSFGGGGGDSTHGAEDRAENSESGEGEGGATVVFGNRLLPRPSRCSMYSAFVEGGWDGAECDEEEAEWGVLGEPGLGAVEEERAHSDGDVGEDEDESENYSQNSYTQKAA
ncbi:uncharacterized protein EKO05_0007086 [Ascochyta rabiei]|uniref:Uncharacterized protein n=1 Tax=Didymella rabiei TaxID=5454 RepID=A0A163G2U2_DIDRA|nr:uncharacterized protein EKO05_0007086 [Ascochyta rabiei]KZM24654.1 hypothetical protein ST47_g4165 [Ascochyta rabiei]UPX16698.1 hypothetical protein EKO05_0007086 [Ascochyta rabiei]